MRSVFSLFAFAAASTLAACSGSSPSGLKGPETSSDSGTGGGVGGGGGDTVIVPTDPGSGDAGVASNCSDAAKLVYLVSEENVLVSFDPSKPGRSAYQSIGTLDCASSSAPQTMGVDRSGTAWVFFSDGHLFKVNVTNARCTSTSYTYPGASSGFMLGSGFTALGGNVANEGLFLLRDGEGLQQFNTSTLTKTSTGGLRATSGELTGGPDGKLFVFDPSSSGRIAEINTSTWAVSTIKTFSSSTFQGVSAFAFARYAGSFYMFTAGTDSSGLFPTTTKTTVFDPVAGTTSIRDADIGITVVGAGQSVCVPPPPIR